MRIVGGVARGRVLEAPRGSDVTRPTSDRVREAVFNLLGQRCDGLAVLDCYAGTGALGLEALSRGAHGAVLVDSGREAQTLCARNAALLGFGASARVLGLPVERALRVLEREGARFELVFADPPYAARAGGWFLGAIDASELIVPGGRIVLEHGRDEQLPPRVGALVQRLDRRYGDTLVAVYERVDPAVGADAGAPGE